MSSALFERVTVIVRHCGERTTEACTHLLRELAPRNPIHQVSARPFQEVLRQSMILGLREARPWTLCIDADVLVVPELQDFIAESETLSRSTFESQALVFDKLLPTRRAAGNHLYRTELLSLALPLIPERDSLRPESDMILAMATKGYPFHQSARLVGIHDFEQTYRDIYLKAFLHGHKHRFLTYLFQPLWATLSAHDDDFRVALAALEDAAKDEAPPQLSRDYGEGQVDSVLDRLTIAPKPALPILRLTEIAGKSAEIFALLDEEMKKVADELQQRIDVALFSPAPPPPERLSLLGRIVRLMRSKAACAVHSQRR